jgi:hypothetical protein
MVGFVLHAGRRTTVVLPFGVEPRHLDLDTLWPSTCSNPLGELCHLRLDGLLDDYIDKFYQRLTCCYEFSEPQQIVIFTGSLDETLKTDVELDAPKTLEDVAALAHAYIQHSTVVIVPPAPSSHRSSGCSVGCSAVTLRPHLRRPNARHSTRHPGSTCPNPS